MRILHAADFHLDSPFEGLSPERAAKRRAEQRDTLERMAGLARSSGAEAVLLAGDLLDGDKAYYETLEFLKRTLGQIGAPVFIAPGNHDPFTPRSPYAAGGWPENVHIFRSPEPEGVELPGLNAVVYGAAFSANSREDSPLRGFHAPEDGKLRLMVLHGDVDARQGSQYCPISSREIAASGLDYLALGHVHACSGVQYAGAVPWAYPGCPEGRGFDETGEKGALCGEVEKGGRARMEFVPLCRRRYRLLELSVAAGDGVEQIAEQALSHAAPDDLVRFVLTGEYGEEPADLTALQERCAGSFYSVSFRDRTRMRRDLWARMEEENLTGLFLRRMYARLSAAGDEARAGLVQQAARFGLAALENREDCAP